MASPSRVPLSVLLLSCSQAETSSNQCICSALYLLHLITNVLHVNTSWVECGYPNSPDLALINRKLLGSHQAAC